MLRYLVAYFYFLRNRITLNHKINGIFKHIEISANLSKELIFEYKSIWSPLNKRANSKWYKVYASIDNNIDPRYVSEIEYYNSIEPVLNHKTFCDAYSDKNFYHNIVDKNLLPETFLRRIYGVYYSADFRKTSSFDNLKRILPSNCEKLIIKKSVDSGGGKGVGLISKVDKTWLDQDGKKVSTASLEKDYGQNFIIQEYLSQHSYYSQFNESSVNTIRLFTYRSVKDESIIPLQTVLRIGQRGSYLDNQASGGVSCGINNIGKLNSFVINKYGEKLERFNNLLLSDMNEAYKFDEIIQIGTQIASSFHYHRLLGFDFTVNNSGDVKLIEINNKNHEINFYQMNNGPLFQDYTDEIIQHCRRNKKTIQLDFEI